MADFIKPWYEGANSGLCISHGALSPTGGSSYQGPVYGRLVGPVRQGHSPRAAAWLEEGLLRRKQAARGEVEETVRMDVLQSSGILKMIHTEPSFSRAGTPGPDQRVSCWFIVHCS
jgi:hypothetical protein